jgi:RimJ/RimL family protein N-acetyltransferase
MPVPYRIETPRLVIRNYHPADAPLLKQAVDRSLAHLKPWMPWAQNGPEPLAVKQQQLRFFRAQFDLDTDYTFGIFNPSETLLLGGTGLHKRGGDYRLEIGYWIDAQSVGQGYVTEAVKALVYAAFHYHGVKGIDICCDPRNHASYAVAQRCGFTHKETLSGKDLTPDGKPRDTMVWCMEQPETLRLPFSMTVYDAAHHRI